MKLWNLVKRNAFPLWRVVKAEPDFYEPTRLIRVKVEKPLSKDSRIKVKGNVLTSDWHRMETPYYWIGYKRYRLREINGDTCANLVKFKARVRVPDLEEQHSKEVRRLIKEEYATMKRWR